MNIVMPLAELRRLLADATPPPGEREPYRPAVRPVIRPADEGARLIAQPDPDREGRRLLVPRAQVAELETLTAPAPEQAADDGLGV